MTVAKTKSNQDPEFLTLRLEKELREQLEARAERNDRSMSAEVRIALRLYLKEAA